MSEQEATGVSGQLVSGVLAPLCAKLLLYYRATG